MASKKVNSSDGASEPQAHKTLVIQSWATAAPGGWLGACLDSVQTWATAKGYDYRFVDDAIFHWLPTDINAKFCAQPVVLSDLARLYLIENALTEGYDSVIWLDADTLVIAPTQLNVPATQYAVGREFWVQVRGKRAGQFKTYKKVHNAFLHFRQGNPFLSFYLDTAERMLAAVVANTVPPQFIGPKLLTALHNIASLPVLESAAMLPPAVSLELLRGEHDQPAANLFRSGNAVDPASVNLCGSAVRSGELSGAQMERLITLLLDKPSVLASSS